MIKNLEFIDEEVISSTTNIFLEKIKKILK